MRIAQLPYLNAWPFRAAWRGDPPRFFGAPPRRLGELAARGELDAAPLASRDALALGEAWRPLPYGVACDGAVWSVLLFSKFPPRKLAGRRIALSGESRTSRGLLRLLLAELWDVENVIFTEDGKPVREPADARLVIGDAALALALARGGTLTPTLSPREGGPECRSRLPLSPGERGLGGEGWPHVVDLGAAWREWTGLPFVYARWVVRRDLPAARVAALLDNLDHTLRHGADPPSQELPPGIGPELARAYLERLIHRLGPREEAGYERFHLELERHDLLGHHSAARPSRRAA